MSPITGILCCAVVRLAAELVTVSADLLQLFGAGKGLRLKIAKRQTVMLRAIYGDVQYYVVDPGRDEEPQAPGWRSAVRRKRRAEDQLYQACKSCDFDLDEYLQNRGK
jgi:hypothetical protein